MESVEVRSRVESEWDREWGWRAELGWKVWGEECESGECGV